MRLFPVAADAPSFKPRPPRHGLVRAWLVSGHWGYWLCGRRTAHGVAASYRCCGPLLASRLADCGLVLWNERRHGAFGAFGLLVGTFRACFWVHCVSSLYAPSALH